MVMDKIYYLEDIHNDHDHDYFYKIVELQNENPHDALAFILYIVMLECGFSPKPSDSLATYNYTKVAEYIEEFLNNQSSLLCRNDNVYNVVMYVNKIKCNLDLLVFSNSLIANLSDSQNHGILKSKSFPCLDELGVSSKYVQIRRICLAFKENIAVPVKILALNEESIFYASLVGTPYDILVYLVKNYLKFPNFVSLVKTCKTMHVLMQEHTIWLNFCKRENIQLVNDENPMTLFKEKWISKKQNNRFNNNPNPNLIYFVS